MNTLTLRQRAENVFGDGEHRQWAEVLIEAADCIENLRAHCRQQRKELRRLNDALQRRHKLNYERILYGVPHRLLALENAVNSVARFVGCAKEAQ